MKVLLASLAISNRGDEAIGRSMLEALSHTKTIEEITILYNGTISPKEEITLSTESPHVKINHQPSVKANFWERKIIYLTFLLPFSISKKLINISPSLKTELITLKTADHVINAPGGIDIGPYQSWSMLWRLFVAQKLAKPTSFYARSYGPLPTGNTIREILFRRIAKETMQKMDHVSLRDRGSQTYAKLDGITFIPTVDCVFMDKNTLLSPPQLMQMHKTNNYVVFTLNELYRWHTWYKGLSTKLLDKFYFDLISFFVSQKINVFLMPHLYGKGHDKQYCEKIASMFKKSEYVTCLPDTYDSYTQQYIIQKSDFLVSARFHSVIFAIKSNTPFLALSYEHKMSETFSQLGLSDYSINIQSFLQKLTSKEDKQNKVTLLLTRLFRQRIDSKKKINIANTLASNIAITTFNDFTNNFLRINN